MTNSVVYLGHKVDVKGIHPIEEVKAIQEAPEPKNVAELKLHVGLLTYYAHFLLNIAAVLEPSYRLLRSGVGWLWAQEERASFKKSKELLISSKELVHYDP